MSVLAVPLLPAAVGATSVALLLAASPTLGAAFGLFVAAGLAVVAVASVGARRVVWGAGALVVLVLTVHSGVPATLISPDLLSFDIPRHTLARPIELLVPAPDAAVLLGIVLGERASIPTELARAFNTSGTTHLLAISGFNMTLVAAAVALVLKGRARPAIAAVASVSAIVAYSLLVGLAPSVLRAALMSLVAAFAITSGRRAASANALCAAVALMLVADPRSVSDLGLQLSALATAGLIVWQGAVAERLAWLPAPIRQGIATTVAATAPTLPVIAGAFGRISLVSVPANLVCVPLFPLIMLAGAATSAVGALSLDAARPVALIAWASAFALRLGVESFAAVPFASLAIPAGLPTGIAVGVVEAAAVLGIRRMPHVEWRPVSRWGALLRDLVAPQSAVGGRALPRRVPALAMTIALVATPPVAAAIWPMASATRVVALDVGQGDAYLVEVGGARALIDGGPDGARVLEELGATLPPWERRIDLVAITHAHTDHGAGLIAVLEHYEVGLAIEPAGLNPGPLTDVWTAAVAKAGATRRVVRAGDRIQLGTATMSVLAPDADVRVDVPSLVLRVEQGSFSALLTGDAMDDELQHLLERPERLRSRVYVPPHHGAATPNASALRQAAHPDAALISVGAGNRYGHPTPQTLAALRGVPTYRTDQDGTVEIALDGTGLVVRTHANALPPPRRGPLPYTPSGG